MEDFRALQNWLSLDKRSLGLFRLALGSVLLLDLVTRGLYFRAHYTSQGIFPLRDFLNQPGVDLRRWSLLFMNDDPVFVGLFFVVAFICALAYLLGYRTRLSGWLCWIIWISLFRRNPVINNGGDMYLPLLLFWGNFLPMGERFSIQSRPETPHFYSRLPGFCYLVQVSILYWFSAVLRSGPEWQVDYSALYYALETTRLNTFASPWLLTAGSQSLAAVTSATIFLEFLGPVLLFLPWWRIRTLSVFLVMSFHLGIIVGLNIPMFALIGVIGPLGLLPGELWETRPAQFVQRRLELLFKALGSRLSGPMPEQTEAPRWSRAAERIYPWLTLPAMLLVLVGLYSGVTKQDIGPLVTVIRGFSLDQRWGMFSPSPPAGSSWDMAPATTSSGLTVDLLTWKELQPDDRPLPHHTEPWNTRWAKFHLVMERDRPGHDRLYLRYLVEKWNQSHPEDQVRTARYEQHYRRTAPGYMLGDPSVRVQASFVQN